MNFPLSYLISCQVRRHVIEAHFVHHRVSNHISATIIMSKTSLSKNTDRSNEIRENVKLRGKFGNGCHKINIMKLKRSSNVAQ